MTIDRWCLVAGAALALLAPAARAQGVAFQPVVGAIPNGPTLGVTPSVSIDRRYVRLGVNPQFIAVEGFNTFLVPAAVGGGPGGPGALGGVGLGRGAVGGEQFLAGMDGVISPARMYGDDGMPTGYGSMNNQPSADFAQQGIAAMPEGPRFNRAAPPRAVTPKVLRRGKTNRAKHPATAASPSVQSKGRP
jgi:hypothetical protein